MFFFQFYLERITSKERTDLVRKAYKVSKNCLLTYIHIFTIMENWRKVCWILIWHTYSLRWSWSRYTVYLTYCTAFCIQIWDIQLNCLNLFHKMSFYIKSLFSKLHAIFLQIIKHNFLHEFFLWVLSSYSYSNVHNTLFSIILTDLESGSHFLFSVSFQSWSIFSI